MSTVQLPIELITAEADGDVIAEGGQVKVDTTSADTELSASFDNVQGILTLTIPKLGTVRAGGFPTSSDVGLGTKGDSGSGGRDGVDGTVGIDGQRGADGCIGPQGQRGEGGKQGIRGQQGQKGYAGNQGIKGDQGDAGKFSVFIQSTEPVGEQVIAGSIWIKL